MLKRLVTWLVTNFKKKYRTYMDDKNNINRKILIPTKRLFQFIDENEDRLFLRPHYIFIRVEGPKKIYSFIDILQLSLMTH